MSTPSETISPSRSETQFHTPPTSDRSSSREEVENVEEDEESEHEDEDEPGPRCLDEIDYDLFEPIWVRGEPVPKGLSEDVKEIVAGDSRGMWPPISPLGIATDTFIATFEIVGSKRTLLHLSGLDEFVAIIDDPACRFEDDTIAVPHGTSNPGHFIIRNEMFDKVIPKYLLERYDGYEDGIPSIPVFPVFGIPPTITADVVMRRIEDLYPTARPQCLPESVRTVRVKYNKNVEKLRDGIHKSFGGKPLDLEQPGVFFRGLTLSAMCMAMSIFCPVIDSRSIDNEFGPGIYTTKDLYTACGYAGSNGAIMVFKDLDDRDLDVWNLDLEEWTRLVFHWRDISLKDVAIPPHYKSADVITGPISSGKDEGVAKKQNRAPKQKNGSSQSAIVSLKGCERLMASLWGIIYISR